MNRPSLRRSLPLVLGLSVSLSLRAPAAQKIGVVIRGQTQYVSFYPAPENPRRTSPKILFLPGDGGWRGFAVAIAQTATSWGYDVYGVDTKRYLEGFTGKMTLKEADVMEDLRQVAEWMRQGSEGGVTLLGWSEGAGLCLLAAASEKNRKTFNGLITLGLGESSVLGWRWEDDLTYLTKKDPDEPMFRSVDYLSKVSPLPLLMIQASRDDYVSAETAKRLFAAARDPKRFSLIEARNHRFEGNREEFFRVLREALQWVNPVSP